MLRVLFVFPFAGVLPLGVLGNPSSGDLSGLIVSLKLDALVNNEVVFSSDPFSLWGVLRDRWLLS